jgi:replicative DNA helicase
MKKLDIEVQILAAIIFNKTAYPTIAHVLKPNNFTSNHITKNREIYEAIEALYPKSDIDLLTIHSMMLSKGTLCDEAKASIAIITNCGVLTDANIKRWAFILLQESIRFAFIDFLMIWRKKREADHDNMELQVLNEIYETVRLPSEDVFTVIEQSIIYFKKVDMIYELEETQSFYKSFENRVKEIKRVSSIETALGFLLDISASAENEVRYNCRKFALAIADMVTTGQTTDSYTKAVNILMGLN